MTSFATADGKTIRGVLDWTVVDSNVMFDRPIALSLQRNGQPVAASAVLRQGSWSFLRTGPGLFILATLGIQLVSLVLALVIVLKRPDDAVAPSGSVAARHHWRVQDRAAGSNRRRVARSACAGQRAVLATARQRRGGAAVFFTFFASFPRKMIRLGRRLAAAVAADGDRACEAAAIRLSVVYAPEQATGPAYQGHVLTAITALYIVAALTALTANYRRLTDVNERRRVKILLVGAVVGLVPGFLVVASYWMQSSAT